MIKKEFYIFLIVSLLSVNIACNTTDSKDSLAFIFNQNVDFKSNSIQFNNEQNAAISFFFNINKKFPLSSENHLDSIFKLIHLNQLDTPTAAFQYVINSTFHNTFPVSESQWSHSPFIFFNSLASGYCDDVSIFLVNLFIELGYEARVVNLEGHVASEVYHEGKWKLFDPDQRVFFRNKNNEVSSLKEIENDNFSINNPNTSFVNYYKKYYLSSENNSVVSGKLNIKEIDTIFTLPSHSSFSMYFDSVQNLNLACVMLSPASKGNLNIPLVPYCIKGGTLKYKLNGELRSINNSDFKKILADYTQLEIVALSDSITIYYLVNPYLKIFKQNNNINVSATNTLQFSDKKLQVPTCSAQLHYWKIEKKFDELYKNKLASYYKDTIFTNFNPNSLEAEFELYSRFYENDLIFQDVLNYKKEIITALSIEETTFDEILADYYPLSTFFLFTSLTENEKAFFIDKFKTVKH